MFNSDLKRQLTEITGYRDFCTKVIDRAVKVLELKVPPEGIQRFNEYGSVWRYPASYEILTHHLDEIEKQRLADAEYEKVAAIVRDLVKRQSLKE